MEIAECLLRKFSLESDDKCVGTYGVRLTPVESKPLRLMQDFMHEASFYSVNHIRHSVKGALSPRYHAWMIERIKWMHGCNIKLQDEVKINTMIPWIHEGRKDNLNLDLTKELKPLPKLPTEVKNFITRRLKMIMADSETELPTIAGMRLDYLD